MEHLVIKDLRKGFRRKNVINDFSAKLQIGKTSGIIGPNGSGKTTLIKCITGLTSFDRGEISFPEDLKNSPIGFCSEETLLFENLTVSSNLKIFAALKSVEENEVSRNISDFGLTSLLNEKIKNLSLGERQKIKIMGSLLANPRIIIFDEPHNGLDPTGFLNFRDLIHKLKAKDTTIIIASHLLSEVRQLCDNVLLVKEGKLLQDISLSENQGIDLEKFFKE